MTQAVGPYRVVDLPPVRQVVVTFLGLSSWGHSIFGFLEVDVTTARRALEQYEARTGERLSFTGYLVYCLARAVDADKSVQAYLKGRKKLLVFDDVDVGMMIEHRFREGQAGENRAPVGHVIRRANHKTFMEIHQEIRTLQAQPPSQRDMPSWLRLMLRLPAPLTGLLVSFVHASMHRDPAGKWVAMAGTVGLTSVGMFGSGSGWGLSAPDGHTLSLVVGGMQRKPAVVGDQIEPREFLSLTVSFDHDVVDGAPAARFTQRLKELIECGYGLDELRG
jgi:pyruvate/2-oxoglutarate dehydrogenase complex dihydrolipoamide acyltransferase (E2) component